MDDEPTRHRQRLVREPRRRGLDPGDGHLGLLVARPPADRPPIPESRLDDSRGPYERIHTGTNHRQTARKVLI